VRVLVVNPAWAKSHERIWYDGLTKNLSKEGMCLYLSEGYNQLDLDDLVGKRIKIEMLVPPDDELLCLLGEICSWTPEEQEQNEEIVTIDTRFVEMTDFHQNSIEKLLEINADDHYMLWDLWDSLRVAE